MRHCANVCELPRRLNLALSSKEHAFRVKPEEQHAANQMRRVGKRQYSWRQAYVMGSLGGRNSVIPKNLERWRRENQSSWRGGFGIRQ